ncbi:hypothetical protein Lfu02_70030 [Longispora fulva]|uniref:Zn-dependent metalloprotease n=1 Tax=Longispora fulva TaxID=619741 RepID=A0A8J7GER8_9ACTN|nr:M4 family metallopeptidase [Longispora fulva]MBG6134453.1 Zn-dependent metalloprotease [Longispora fulva]GIG62631.1 hypothetical protein Lfu02_70030 [Longispora fulva]
MERTTLRRAVLAGTGIALVGGVLAVPLISAAADPRPVSPSTAVRDARNTLSAHRAELHAGADDAFEPRDAIVDPNGTRHVRFDRTYRGLPVLGGDTIVHSAPGGQFRDATVTLPTALNLSTQATVPAARAADAASAAFTGHTVRATPQLAVDATGARPVLVWRVGVDGVGSDGGPSQLTVYVDATTGQVRRSSTQVTSLLARKPGTGARTTAAHATQTALVPGSGKGYHDGDVTVSTTRRADGQYEMKDPARGNGETRDAGDADAPGGAPPAGWGTAITDADNAWGDGTAANRQTAAVDAHYGIQATWDYYKSTHNRSGIRNDGVGSRSFVHYGTKLDNAYWMDECFCMVYGDGASGSSPLTSLDVTGHEMSHGVTAATAKLDYGNPDAGVYVESGGINEANSDIFGTLVEFAANNPADVPDYLIGEKINIFGDGRPLRYMDDPAKDGSSKTCWYPGMGTSIDPHLSSGIGNHLFFLLAVGSGTRTVNGVSYNSPSCGAPAVNGIGNDKAGKIWYRALTTYMVSTETYPLARVSTIRAANDLYGAAECAAVKAAWTATGVGAQAGEPACAGTPTPAGSPSPSPVGGSCAATQAVPNPGFEAGDTPWTASPGVLGAFADQPAHSGTRDAWLNGYGTAHTDSLSQQVKVPSGCTTVTLSYWLHVDTAETGGTAYDTLTATLGTKAVGSYSNADSKAGYTKRTFDVSALAGQTVTLAFQGVEDSSLKTSFVLDDITIDASGGSTGPTPSPTPPVADGTRTPYNAAYDVKLTSDATGANWTGTEKVTFTNASDSPLDKVVLRLWDNWRNGCTGTPITVGNVTGGTAATPTVNCTALTVTLPAPLAKGASGSVSFDLSIAVPDGSDRFGRDGAYSFVGNALPVLAVRDAAGWHLDPYTNNGESFYTLASDFTVVLDHPSALRIPATGTSTTAPGGTGRTVTTATAKKVRDFAWAAGPFSTSSVTSPGGVTVRTWWTSGITASAAAGAQATAAAAMDGHASRFGAYPYGEVDVVLHSNFWFGGMEYPGVVFTQATAVTHELGHQWFYGIVGDDEYANPWLDEAFTDYATDLQDGIDGAGCSISWESAAEKLTNSMGYWDQHSTRYATVVYGYGKCTLHDLRRVLGDTAMANLMREYAQAHWYGVSTTAEFKAAAQAKTSTDLTSFWASHRVES